MILVDSTVVIDYTRGKDLKLRRLVQSLASMSISVCGVVRAEVLSVARNAADRGKLLSELNTFQHIVTPESIWDIMGDNVATLLSRGLTVPLPDALIATLGIENDMEVWSRDPHFPAMQKHLPKLRLFQEPP